MFIQIEETPNPNTLKFMPGLMVKSDGKSNDFTKIEETKNFPLATLLFNIDHVERVFFGLDFISITKSSDIDWEVLKPDILSTIVEYLTAGKPMYIAEQDVMDNELQDNEEFFEESDTELVNKIKELIENYVRPAVAQDGGDIVFKGYSKGTVFVRLKGACSGCPSATITLKQGVQNMLNYHIPEVIAVEEDME